MVKEEHFEESISIEGRRVGGSVEKREKGELLMVGTEPSIQDFGLNKLTTSGKQLEDHSFNE